MPLIHPAKGGGHLIAGDDQDKLLCVVFFRVEKIVNLWYNSLHQTATSLRSVFFYKTTGALF